MKISCTGLVLGTLMLACVALAMHDSPWPSSSPYYPSSDYDHHFSTFADEPRYQPTLRNPDLDYPMGSGPPLWNADNINLRDVMGPAESTAYIADANSCKNQTVLACLQSMSNVTLLHKMLNTTVDEAKELRDMLNDPNKRVTLLAPNDRAMRKAGLYLTYHMALPITPRLLSEVVRYHIVGDNLNLTTLAPGSYRMVTTKFDNPDFVNLNGTGQNLMVYRTHNNQTELYGNVFHAPMFTTRVHNNTIECSNGAIAVLDGVLIPPLPLSSILRLTNNPAMAASPAIAIMAGSLAGSTIIVPPPAVVDRMANRLLDVIRTGDVSERDDDDDDDDARRASGPGSVRTPPGSALPGVSREELTHRCEEAVRASAQPREALRSYATLVGINLPEFRFNCPRIADHVFGAANQPAPTAEEIRRSCEETRTWIADHDADIRREAERFGVRLHEPVTDCGVFTSRVIEARSRAAAEANRAANASTPAVNATTPTNASVPVVATRVATIMRRRRDRRDEDMDRPELPDLDEMVETCNDTNTRFGIGAVRQMGAAFNVTVTEPLNCTRVAQNVRDRMEQILANMTAMDAARRNNSRSSNSRSPNAPSDSRVNFRPMGEYSDMFTHTTRDFNAFDEPAPVAAPVGSPGTPEHRIFTNENLQKTCERIIEMDRTQGAAARDFFRAMGIEMQAPEFNCTQAINRFHELRLRAIEYANSHDVHNIDQALARLPNIEETCMRYMETGRNHMARIRETMQRLGIETTSEPQVDCRTFAMRLGDIIRGLNSTLRQRDFTTFSSSVPGIENDMEPESYPDSYYPSGHHFTSSADPMQPGMANPPPPGQPRHEEEGGRGGFNIDTKTMEKIMKHQIKKLMTYIIPNRVVTPADLATLTPLKCALGREIPVTVEDKSTMAYDPSSDSFQRRPVKTYSIGGARVTGASLTRNGMAIFVDRAIRHHV